MRNDHRAEHQIAAQQRKTHLWHAFPRPAARIHAAARRRQRQQQQRQQRRFEHEPHNVFHRVAHRPADRGQQIGKPALVRAVRRHADTVARRDHRKQQPDADGNQQQRRAKRRLPLVRRQPPEHQHQQRRRRHHRGDVVIHAQRKEQRPAERKTEQRFRAANGALAQAVSQRKRHQRDGLRAHVKPRAVEPVHALHDIRQEQQLHGGKRQKRRAPRQTQPFFQKMPQKHTRSQQAERQQHDGMRAVMRKRKHRRVERHDDHARHGSLPVAPRAQGIAERVLEHVQHASGLHPRRMGVDGEGEIIRRRVRRLRAEKERREQQSPKQNTQNRKRFFEGFHVSFVRPSCRFP